jgi:hypothetical protein
LWTLALVSSAAGTPAQSSAANSRSSLAITLTLKEAPADEAAKSLGVALGASIRLVPTEGSWRHVTLQLVETGPLEALDRLAAAVNGRWQPVYSLRRAAPDEAPAPPPFATGRRVTLNLENVAPRVALSTVAAADKGVLEGTAAEEPRLSLKLDDVAVEEGMNRVVGALGLVWTRGFQIVLGSVRSGSPLPAGSPDSGRAAPGGSSEPAQMPHPAEKLFSLTEPPSAQAPMSERTPPVKSPDLARALSDGMARLMQVEPARRGSAIRQFAQQVERGLREVDLLPVPEQSQQRTRLARVYQSGMRMYRGLTPDQQQEFRPLFDVLRRWLKL